MPLFRVMVREVLEHYFNVEAASAAQVEEWKYAVEDMDALADLCSEPTGHALEVPERDVLDVRPLPALPAGEAVHYRFHPLEEGI